MLSLCVCGCVGGRQVGGAKTTPGASNIDHIDNNKTDSDEGEYYVVVKQRYIYLLRAQLRRQTFANLGVKI